jgi:quercetin dioxygenase-like cupin family protein
MKSKWMWALLAVVMGAGSYAGVVLATPATGQTTTTLAKATVDPLDLTGSAPTTTVGNNGDVHPDGLWQAWIKTHGASDIYVVDNKFAPGGSTGWHSHPGPSLVFVVSGTVTNYTSDDPSCTPHVYAAGSSLVDPGGTDEHILRNEGSVPAETIAVQFLPQGAQRRIDEPAPGNCPF